MKKVIITIGRQYGSGGREIGHLVAERLNIPCYDGSIIDKTAKVSELSPEFVEKNEQQLSNLFIFDMSMMLQIYKAQSTVIKECAQKGSCVIVGRCAEQILEQDYSCLKVFLYADFDKRYQRAITQYGDKAQGIEDFVRKKDKSRKRFFQIFHEKEWEKAFHYNLCLDTGLFGVDGTVEMIVQAYHMMAKEEVYE